MSAAVIATRISAAIEQNLLAPCPDPVNFRQVEVVSDLLRPWSEIYPDGTAGELLDRQGGRGNRHIRARFTPQTRRSRRQLPPPRKIVASPKVISPEFLGSMRAIWQYYEAHGMADPTLLQELVTATGLNKFVEPLWQKCSDYYPLGNELEDFGYQCSIFDQGAIQLIIPHYVYEQEECAAVEAFLSGVSGVHSLMEEYYENRDRQEERIELPPKDHDLIKRVGFAELVRTYATYPGEKTCDINRLENFSENFFQEVSTRWPELWDRGWDIISGNGGGDNYMPITSSDDIEFALAYSEAFTAMICAMPEPYGMDSNRDGEAETFMHELCEVWRKANGKRSVKWESEKRSRLAYRVKIGDL